MKKTSLFFIFLVFITTALGVFFVHPDFWGTTTRPWKLGLDLVGGSHLVYEVDMTDVLDADRGSVLSGLRDVIERRVNLFGVSEPQVLTAQTGGSYRLIVELAGIKDVATAIKQIGETPFLYFAEETGAGAVHLARLRRR
jgi:preprotein translocase subunit SecD